MSFSDLIGPDSNAINWWQMSVRAVVIFFYGLFLVRLGAQRAFGRIAAFDIVLGVMLGSLLSRTISGNSPFVPTIIASAALVVAHAMLASAAHRWTAFGHFVKGRERRLVEDGRPIREAMRNANVTEHDLEEALRLHGGIDDLAKVKGAWLERNGDISVVTRED
jgi:uncharacterized membrane protein YcaP (DUF421 family)